MHQTKATITYCEGENFSQQLFIALPTSAFAASASSSLETKAHGASPLALLMHHHNFIDHRIASATMESLISHIRGERVSPSAEIGELLVEGSSELMQSVLRILPSPRNVTVAPLWFSGLGFLRGLENPSIQHLDQARSTAPTLHIGSRINSEFLLANSAPLIVCVGEIGNAEPVVTALKNLLSQRTILERPSEIHIVTLSASAQGCLELLQHFPSVQIHTGMPPGIFTEDGRIGDAETNRKRLDLENAFLKGVLDYPFLAALYVDGLIDAASLDRMYKVLPLSAHP